MSLFSNKLEKWRKLVLHHLPPSPLVYHQIPCKWQNNEEKCVRVVNNYFVGGDGNWQLMMMMLIRCCFFCCPNNGQSHPHWKIVEALKDYLRRCDKGTKMGILRNYRRLMSSLEREVIDFIQVNYRGQRGGNIEIERSFRGSNFLLYQIWLKDSLGSTQISWRLDCC